MYIYPSEDINALCNAIKQEDILLVEFFSKKIIGYIEHELTDPFMLRCVCYDAINQMLKSTEAEHSGWIHSVCRDITENLTYSTAEDLLLIFRTLCSRVIIDMEVRSDRPLHLGIKDAVAYVDMHFRDADLSAKAIAADYNMTVSNFSHQFKKFSGMTVTGYINEKRISYAKQLLQETDYSVAEIAGKSGYLYPSSFIRKYKQEEKITPGEYQEKCRGERFTAEGCSKSI